MSVVLTDEEIQRLLGESKPLGADYRRRLKLKARRGHKESELEVTGADGSEFRVRMRQSESNPLDFSVILGYCLPNSNRLFRLRRYNGKSHEHCNRLEGERFYDFHIHEATERYQAEGAEEEKFARITDRYTTVEGALECLMGDCGFVRPEDDQQSLL
mgnify:FL=1